MIERSCAVRLRHRFLDVRLTACHANRTSLPQFRHLHRPAPITRDGQNCSLSAGQFGDAAASGAELQNNSLSPQIGHRTGTPRSKAIARSATMMASPERARTRACGPRPIDELAMSNPTNQITKTHEAMEKKIANSLIRVESTDCGTASLALNYETDSYR